MIIWTGFAMMKSAKLKRKTRRLLIKNLIVFTVLIAVVSVGVRSWFNKDEVKKAKATGMSEVTCSVPEGLEVAILPPGGSVTAQTVWHDETFTISASDYSFLSALSFTEITSDGKSFIKPKIKQYGSVAIADTSSVSSWETAIANSEYLSVDLVFRTTASSATVILDQENTYCGPESSTQTWGNTLNGWEPDTVIGAARVCFVDFDYINSNTRSEWQKLLWIPAPFLHFDPIVRTETDAALISNITDPSNNYGLDYYNESSNLVHNHQDGTYNHGYYTRSGNTATHSVVSYSGDVTNANINVTANTSLAADQKYHLPYDVTITSLDTDATYDGVAYKQHRVRLNIWIEGEDPESRSAQVTGQFKAIIGLKLGNS